MTSERTIERLSKYRRIMEQLRQRGEANVFSHQLADQAGCTPAQVRRDLMVISGDGTPSRGYDIDAFLKGLNEFLAGAEKHLLIGVGNLGRALLAYFDQRRASLSVVAAFDKDPNLQDRVIHGCRCYGMEQLETIIAAENIRVAILAIPAGGAQETADTLFRLGVRGFLNFAPTVLQLPPGAFVENIDMTMALEKVSFFANQQAAPLAATGE